MYKTVSYLLLQILSHPDRTLFHCCFVTDGNFSKKLGGPEKGRFVCSLTAICSLLAAGVLGDGFGSLRDGVLGQFTGQEKTNGSLDFSAGDG